MVPAVFRRAGAAVLALALTLGLAGSNEGSMAEARATAFSPAAEAKKMDAIATPALNWYRCTETAECTTVEVPRDYDRPRGAKVELALLRVKARDQKNRIGSLFINPGGPGGSATLFAEAAPYLFSPRLLDRFDIVGMDPRGVGFSDNVTCLTARRQQPVLDAYRLWFPLGSAQEKAWIASDKTLGRGCSNDALGKSMSSAEVARDMELMRRAVGDRQLSYLGFSYGSYLGQVYAAMFPDRFRTVAVDGVLDPVAWAGDAANQRQPLGRRMDAAAGAWKALREILERCDEAGGTRCRFAPGDPVENLGLIADRLKKSPLTIEDEEFGVTFTLTYQDLVVILLSSLYDPAGYQLVDEVLSDLWVLTEPPSVAARGADPRRAEAATRLTQARRAVAESGSRPPLGFPYDNGFDTLASISCTDSTETTKSAQYPAIAAAEDRRAPYFGRVWLWTFSVCADDAFTGEDEDAYRGPFTTKTSAPLLYVGNYYDPATSYTGAVAAAKRLPNSRLLSSDSFGHTAYGTSSCVTDRVDAYLLSGALPAPGTLCRGDVQPFASSPEDLEENALRQQALRGAGVQRR